MGNMTAKVHHAEVYGTRENKLEYLRTHTLFLPHAEAEEAGLGEAATLAGSPSAASPPAEADPSPAESRPFRLDLWPNALLVPPAVYRGVCRAIVQGECIHSLQAVSSARFAAQVAAHLSEDAAAEWIREDEARYLECLRVGLRPEETP